jgi:hypothetical protein
MKKVTFLISVVLCLVCFSATAFASGPPGKKHKGQTVYVPAVHNDFSYYDGSGELIFRQMGITRLIIRNIDPDNSITLISVNFHDPEGELRLEYIQEPEIISPFASVTYLATPSVTGLPLWDRNEFARPSFIVEWKAKKKTHPPIIEGARCLLRPVQEGQAWLIQALDLTSGTVIREKR